MALTLASIEGRDFLHERSACLVCGATLFTGGLKDSPVCERSDCKQVLAQKELMLPAAFERYLRFRSERIRGSIEREQARTKIEEKLREQEREENRAFWKAKLQVLPATYSSESFPLVAIPSCRRKIVNLSEKRRRRFRDSLQRSLSKAVAERLHRSPEATKLPDSNPVDSTLQRINDQSCTICAGGCCTQGGDHAYLNEDTLLRVMDQRPNLRPRDVFASYLDRVGTKTYADSCIFHTACGCALPPDLRSSTCLNYFCSGLEQFSAAFNGRVKPQGAFVVVRSREPWGSLGDRNNRIDCCYILKADGSAKQIS